MYFQHPNLTDITLPMPKKKFKGYYKIARHYKWAIDQIFHKFNYTAVIIVEGNVSFRSILYFFTAT
jgi:alpha-1,3-mannosyl-glycoprotein beta-1,2-N-acetylglucosaminyltransferase